MKELENFWITSLIDSYPEREIKNMFTYYLEDVFNLNRLSVIGNPSFQMSPTQKAEMFAVVERLKGGEPYQYIVGFTYFADLKIQTDCRALIPRPETEELVYWILEECSVPSQQVLDWCSGSGCIALALKQHQPTWHVEGFDWSEDAINLAQTNGQLLQLNVPFHKQNALDCTHRNQWDIIVSNPPYIPEAELQTMRKNVVNFEPEMALFVPNYSPLMFYEAIADYARINLTENGNLFFELHENYAQETEQLLTEMGFCSIEIRKDLQGKDRFLKAVYHSSIP